MGYRYQKRTFLAFKDARGRRNGQYLRLNTTTFRTFRSFMTA